MTWLYYDEANDLAFCHIYVWLHTKTVNWTVITMTKHLSSKYLLTAFSNLSRVEIVVHSLVVGFETRLNTAT